MFYEENGMMVACEEGIQKRIMKKQIILYYGFSV